MKFILSFIFIILLLNYCSNQTESEVLDISRTYIVTDSAGTEKYNFTKNEKFRVKFEITNNSDEELTYDTGLPIISFTIKNGDTIICGSTDHMSYIAIWFTGRLKAERSIEEIWDGAPNTSGRIASNYLIALEPGTYTISVHHASFFNEIELPKTDDLIINIIE
jgi:hypothetical protein